MLTAMANQKIEKYPKEPVRTQNKFKKTTLNTGKRKRLVHN